MDSISSLPRLALGRWPTPVRRMEKASTALGIEVFVKLEAECGAWGATKVRKLEYLLAEVEASGSSSVSAAGAGSSTWTATVAHHAAARGLDAMVWLAGPVPRELDRLYERAGTRVRSFPGLASAPLAAAAARLGRGHLPAGGSGGVGDLGGVHAGLEIADSVRGGDMPEPREVFVACGTAGTVAGISVGMKLGGIRSLAVAVRVTPYPLGSPRHVAYRVARLETLLHLEEATEVAGRSGLGPGYGRPGPAGLEARALARADGVDLDPGYSAKAFAALIDSSRRGSEGPVLLVNTSPGPYV